MFKLTFRMSRPPVAMILLLFAVIGATHKGVILQPSWNLLALALIVVAILINAATLNDLADEAIDRVNLAGSTARPLASNLASRRQIWYLAVGSGLTAITIAGLINLKLLPVVLAGLLFNWIYSMRPLQLSHRGYLAPLVLPWAYAAVPFLIGLIGTDGRINRSSFILISGLYICFVGRIILKDFRDVKGDKQFGKTTFLLRYGRQATCITSAIFWAAGAAILATVSPMFALILAIYLPMIFLALYLLYKSSIFHTEQLIIWSSARIGAAIAMGIFMAIQVSGNPALRQLAVVFGAGLPFVGLYWSNIKNLIKLESTNLRPSVRIVAGASKTPAKPLQDVYW